MEANRILPALLAVSLVGPGVPPDAAMAQCYTLAHTFDDPTPDDHEYFAARLDLEGDRVFVAAPYNEPNDPSLVGQVHLYDAVSGALLRTFADPSPTNWDAFGADIAVEGSRVLIGAPGDDQAGTNVGQAHLFDVNSGELIHTFDDPTPTVGGHLIGDVFGASLDIDARHVVIAAPLDNTAGIDRGQVHVFHADTGALLRTLEDPTPTDADTFGGVDGAGVALSGDRVLIGSTLDDTLGQNVGQAYLFDVNSGELLHILDDPAPTGGDRFGISLDLDGDRVLVADWRDDTARLNAGQAHLFDAVTGDLLHTFQDPTPTVEDGFSSTVVLSGSLALIGDMNDDTVALNAGQTHVFDVATGALIWTMDEPTPTAGDNFGLVGDMDGDRVLIGAPRDDTNGENAGEAHLFQLRTEEDVCACLAADFDGNGAVELEDLATLLNDFGCSDAPGFCEGDIDRDGDTDLTDLSLVLTVYGNACG